MWRVLGVVLVLVLLIGAVLFYRTLNAAGSFNDVTPQFAGKCEALPGVVGAEDIEIDRATGRVFISVQDRRPLTAVPEKEGGIYLAAIDRPGEAPQQLAGTSAPFHPHGISLYADGNGRKTLAVINHARVADDQIQLYDVIEQHQPNGAVAVSLSLRRAVKDPLFVHPNDVTLVGHESFYITNDHGSESALGEALETWLLLPRANVVYYDGAAARVAAGSLNYANGINRSADLATIYVAESTGRTLTTYRRDMNTGELGALHALFLGVGLDNIDVDSDGNLWIAGHPRLFDFLAHSQDASKHSPSVVLKVNPTAEDGGVETIYANLGEEISGSSVAAFDKGRLLIGSVFEPKYLNCTVDQPAAPAS